MRNKPKLVFYKFKNHNGDIPSFRRIFKDTYSCGWLFDGNERYIIQWGNSKNRENAEKLMEDVLKKQGELDVIFFDKELPVEPKKGSRIITLPDWLYDKILNESEVWHKDQSNESK